MPLHSHSRSLPHYFTVKCILLTARRTDARLLLTRHATDHWFVRHATSANSTDTKRSCNCVTSSDTKKLRERRRRRRRGERPSLPPSLPPSSSSRPPSRYGGGARAALRHCDCGGCGIVGAARGAIYEGSECACALVPVPPTFSRNDRKEGRETGMTDGERERSGACSYVVSGPANSNQVQDS